MAPQKTKSAKPNGHTKAGAKPLKPKHSDAHGQSSGGSELPGRRAQFREAILYLLEVAAFAERHVDSVRDRTTRSLFRIVGAEVDRHRKQSLKHEFRTDMGPLADELGAIYAEYARELKMSGKDYSHRVLDLFVPYRYFLDADAQGEVLLERSEIKDKGGPKSAAASVVGKLLGGSKRTAQYQRQAGRAWNAGTTPSPRRSVELRATPRQVREFVEDLVRLRAHEETQRVSDTTERWVGPRSNLDILNASEPLDADAPITAADVLDLRKIRRDQSRWRSKQRRR